MPSLPVTRTPSFIPSVYPYELTITISTEASPSTLKLPQYQIIEQAPNTSPRHSGEVMSSKEDQLPVDRENVGRCDCAEWEKPTYKFVANSRIILHKAASQETVQVESCAAKVDVRQEGECLENNEGRLVSLPIWQEKAIYRQGKFKWAISTGVGPIASPPPPANLSDGDVFIRVDTDATSQRIQAWYLSSTASSSVLVWKAIVPLHDIRYIGNDPYVLSIHGDEPSWILARSAAHPQMRSRRLNASNSAQSRPTQTQSKNQHTARKRNAKRKIPM